MPAAATRGDALRMRFSGADVGGPKAVGTIPGAAVIAAAGLCGEGIAALASHNDGMDLCFRAPGSTKYGPLVRCASDGDYLLEDGADKNKFARVSVRAAFLAPTPQQARVFLKYQAGDMILDTGPSAVIGLGLTLRNAAAVKLENIRVWCPTPNTTFNLGSGDVAAATEETALLVGTLNPAATKALGMKLTVGAVPGSPREFVDVRAKWDSL